MDSDITIKHKYIKLIEFAIENKSFSGQRACVASGLDERKSNGAKFSMFVLQGKHEQIESTHESLEWWLKQDAYFSYVSFLEFQHSLKASRRAHWLAVSSLIFAAVSIQVSAYD